MKIILGSSSINRLKLLRSIGINPDQIYSPDIDEYVVKKEKINDTVHRIAQQKINKTIELFPYDCIICADSMVYCANQIIGKPKDINDAERIIKLLSGRKNKIYTCVTVYDSIRGIRNKIVSTTITFKRLSDLEVKYHLNSHAWENHCGGYTLEGASGRLIRSINGSYSNVLGLPLYETICLINNPELTDRF